ncbi:MAG: hypothetical protein IKY44_03200 [Clostridia bacterium]|nr:hypothetical protein [Clostridia bacterium]
MWISKKLAESNNQALESNTEIGNLSITTDELIAAISSCEKRGISFYTPPGIEFYPSEGQRVLLISCGNQTVCAGVEMQKSSTLRSGEIRLFSQGGASIVLKNNGSIVLNGKVTITKDGDILTDGIISALNIPEEY